MNVLRRMVCVCLQLRAGELHSHPYMPASQRSYTLRFLRAFLVAHTSKPLSSSRQALLTRMMASVADELAAFLQQQVLRLVDGTPNSDVASGLASSSPSASEAAPPSLVPVALLQAALLACPDVAAFVKTAWNVVQHVAGKLESSVAVVLASSEGVSVDEATRLAIPRSLCVPFNGLFKACRLCCGSWLLRVSN